MRKTNTGDFQRLDSSTVFLQIDIMLLEWTETDARCSKMESWRVVMGLYIIKM